jgi:N-acetylmuramoyl-L-alanine amidase
MPQQVTGEAILALGRNHIGEKYVLGARAPMGNSKWNGPWDCAEFVSWCVYQVSGILYGTKPTSDPIRADAYTGFWWEQAHADRATVEVSAAASIEGAILLRAPSPQAIGHIAFSDGKGGTVEAHSSKRGVIHGEASGRRWDRGVVVPGVLYFQSETPVVVTQPAFVLRVTDPLTRGANVKKIQRALVSAGFFPGRADGIFGPQTAHAVQQFQNAKGLVPDGEVGPATLQALKIKL